jgi:hypothetical protein
VSRDLWRQVLLRAECDESSFCFDEIQSWLPGELEHLTRLGLVHEGDRARFVACDACSDWHSEEVMWLPSVRDASGMRAYIPCPAEGGVHVPDERLRQWSVDIGALARQLAAAMELAGTVEDVLVGHLWKLGRRRLAGRFRDVFFAVARSYDDGGIPEAATRHLNATHGVLLALGNLKRMDGWGLPHFTVFDVKAITVLTGGGLEVALDYIEDALPRERGPEKLTGIRSVALPDGTAWEDLTIEVAETSLMVSAGAFEKEMSLEEAGFVDGRQGESASDRPLQFLRLFATRRGCIASAELPGGERGKSRVQKQISVLRSRLRSLFAIGEEPIIFDKASGEYRCAFGARMRADDGFPTPAGASWLDFRFEELAGGRLAVGVKSKEVFRARQIQKDDGRTITETAEREDRTWREYSLVSLGLANDSGNPTPEGRALLECLRSEGKLQRPPEDMAVLKVGRWLRRWTGIEDDPINYSDSRKAWMAHFECGATRMQ